jgi:hypothetical protein
MFLPFYCYDTTLGVAKQGFISPKKLLLLWKKRKFLKNWAYHQMKEKFTLYLVKHGKLGAGDASRESGVSYQQDLQCFRFLYINKGLVKVIPEKSKKFIPTDPRYLLELVDQKAEKKEIARDKIKDLQQFYKIADKNPVIMELEKQVFIKL